MSTSIFAALRRGDPGSKMVYIEAERWVDARTFALCMFSGAEIDLPPAIQRTDLVRSRWQIRWIGQAGGDPTPTMQARFVYARDSDADVEWRNVRDIDFSP